MEKQRHRHVSNSLEQRRPSIYGFIVLFLTHPERHTRQLHALPRTTGRIEPTPTCNMFVTYVHVHVVALPRSERTLPAEKLARPRRHAPHAHRSTRGFTTLPCLALTARGSMLWHCVAQQKKHLNQLRDSIIPPPCSSVPDGSAPPCSSSPPPCSSSAPV